MNDAPRHSIFTSETGPEELFLVIESETGKDFPTALDETAIRYTEAQKALGLSESTQVFSRLFLSDIENQMPSLRKSPLFHTLSHGSLSIIQQRPIEGRQLGLFSYHIKSAAGTFARERLNHPGIGESNAVILKGRHYSMLWTANFKGDGALGAEHQSGDILRSLDILLEANNMCLRGNTIRTWIYVRDIDSNYMSMVKARRKHFLDKGLNEKTRYLASTGIEGRGSESRSLVAMDSLSIGGVSSGQIVRMEAPDHLSPTIKYGVTFERGLKVVFGDRSHLHVSGTASINSEGELLFPFDVIRQTERTLENIRALLLPHGADFEDLAYVLIYLRNPAEWPMVRKVVSRHIPPAIPRLALEAQVCRSGWLVEIEGLAIRNESTSFEPFF